MALNISWKDHIRNVDLYDTSLGHRKSQSLTHARRRTLCSTSGARGKWNGLILWEPTHEKYVLEIQNQLVLYRCGTKYAIYVEILISDDITYIIFVMRKNLKYEQ